MTTEPLFTGAQIGSAQPTIESKILKRIGMLEREKERKQASLSDNEALKQCERDYIRTQIDKLEFTINEFQLLLKQELPIISLF